MSKQTTAQLIARGEALVREIDAVFPRTDATERKDALSPCPKCGAETVTERTDDGHPWPKWYWVRYCPECCWSVRLDDTRNDD